MDTKLAKHIDVHNMFMIVGYLVNNDVPLIIGSCCGEHFLNGCLDEVKQHVKVVGFVGAY